MSATESIVAPTDAQLAYIASLCREQGWPPPEAVHSKREASAIIDAIRASTYRPEEYVPISDAELFANGESMYDPDMGDDYEDVPF